jgi:hypothetical protein
VKQSAAAIVLLLLAACRSAAPAAEAPFVPGTPLNSLHAVRSLMHVRATRGENTQSFRAQLLVEPATERLEMNAYTPVGTSAFTLYAEGVRVVFLDRIHRMRWEGDSREIALLGGVRPAAWALAVLGYPEELHGITIEGAPPEVTLRRGAERVEIRHLEVVATGASPRAPKIPRGYTCCIRPEL